MSKNLISEGLMRTHTCGELRQTHAAETVKLCGWVNKYRDLGGLHFIDIRDKYGLTQLNFENYKGDFNILKKCSLESTIIAEGLVRERPASAQNKKMPTGSIEIVVEKIDVLSQCDVDNIPFLPHGHIEATEDQRLKYRYIDLRTNRLQEMLKLRSKVTTTVRQLLTEENFIEVETPILYKSTPEGARDYIVPSRVHPGSVYALPQSPQTLKQLLMIGNTDRYFQICRCFRDEDLRADRQPEFTQIDIECSFVTPIYIKKLAEKIIGNLFQLGDEFEMEKITYARAMDLYGCDKPDARFGLKHMIVSELFKDSDFAVLSGPANSDGLVKAMFVPAHMGTFSRKDTDGFANIVKPHGGKGVAFFKVTDGARSGGISKFITDELYSKLEKLNEESGDGTWLFFADKSKSVAHACADAVRRFLGESLKLTGSEYKFLWVYDFPLLEWDEKANRFFAMHHPFTAPKDCQQDNFLNGENETLKNILAEAYDVVCNGYELGGGSIRIHQQKLQDKMFEVLGFSEKEKQSQFGFFLEALKYGVPPHGGIAFGLDRVIMLLSGTDSIRDVMAFPKTTSASDLMAHAPSKPAQSQLDELHFNWNKQ